MATETLIWPADKTIPVTVQTRTALVPAEAFEVIVPIDVSLVFTRWGPFPGVRRVTEQSGTWDCAGRTRSPELTDGTTVVERLTEYTPPSSFAYELTHFSGVMRHLVIGVRGEWTFTPDCRGTVIRWTYEFKARPGRQVALRRGVVPAWHRYMQSAIARTTRAAERIATQE